MIDVAPVSIRIFPSPERNMPEPDCCGAPPCANWVVVLQSAHAAGCGFIGDTAQSAYHRRELSAMGVPRTASHFSSAAYTKSCAFRSRSSSEPLCIQ